MKAFLLTLGGLTLIFLSFGGGSDESPRPEVLNRAQSLYGGDWYRIPEDDRRALIRHFDGDRETAKREVKLAAMAVEPTVRW